MNLNQLIYFKKICELGSISRTAEALHISQPSVTNAMKNLEHELGVDLLDRSNKKLSITNEGKHFLKRVNKILNEIDNAVTEMNDFRVNKREILKIGIPPMICSFLFPDIFLGFHESHPDIELKAFEFGSGDIVEMIEKNELDLGIIILDSTNEHLERKLIIETETHICFNKENSLSKLDHISIKDLESEPIIMLNEGFYHHKILNKRFKENSIIPNIIFHTSDLMTIKSFIKKDIGISFLIKEIVKDDENISHLPLDNPLTIEIGIVWRKDKYLSNAVHRFVDYVTLQ